MSCPLCETLRGDQPLFRTDHAAVVIHDDWAVVPHLVVVSTVHVENSAELSRPAFDGFFALFRAAETALLRDLGADRVIVMKLGLAVPHLHHHLYPFSSSASRDDVMRAINMQVRHEPDSAMKQQIRERLETSLPRYLNG